MLASSISWPRRRSMPVAGSGSVSLPGSGPGRARPVSSLALSRCAIRCSRSSTEWAATSCLRARPRRLGDAGTASPNTMSMTTPLAGSELLPAPGSRVPNCTTGTIGAPVTMARYAAPCGTGRSHPRRGTPRGRCRPRGRSAAPAGSASRPAGRRGTGPAGSGPLLSRNRFMNALEHLLLGQRVHRPRGEDRQQRAVDDADVVGRRR